MQKNIKILIGLGISIVVGLLVACIHIPTGMTIFTLAIISFCAMALFMAIFRTGFSFNEFTTHLSKRFDESKENKKYGQATIYAVVLPMMVVGLLVTIPMVIVMIYNLTLIWNGE